MMVEFASGSYIKAMNNIKKRLDRLNLDFEFRGNNIKDIYPIPIDEITNETLIAIANKDKAKLKELMTRDNFLARDYIKYTNGFQSTIIEELKQRDYIFPLISSNDLVMENMKGKSKSSSNVKSREVVSLTISLGVKCSPAVSFEASENFRISSSNINPIS